MIESPEAVGSQKMFRALQGWRLLLPIIIGIGVVGYLFWDEFDYNAFQNIPLTQYAIIWFLCALVMMILRDVGYVIRLKILSGKDLSWVQCIRIIFLWEFTSAVTPSAVGGTSFAVIYIYKEQENLGKSSATVMATAFLDELYFLIMFPLLIFSIDFNRLFEISDTHEMSTDWSTGLMYFAVIGYILKALFTLLVFYGLFINPKGIQRLLFRVFSIKGIKKWRRKGIKVGKDIMLASEEYKGKSWKFWAASFVATWISWTSRYWVVNFLFLAYFIVPDHFLLFARQLVMWIMMLVLPSPGGSGFSELIFSEYLGEFIPYMYLIPVFAILWRLVTYYPYLLIGSFLLPWWIKKKF